MKRPKIRMAVPVILLASLLPLSNGCAIVGGVLLVDAIVKNHQKKKLVQTQPKQPKKQAKKQPPGPKKCPVIEVEEVK